MADISVPALTNTKNVAGLGLSAWDLVGIAIASRATDVAFMKSPLGTGNWKSAIAKFLGAGLIYGLGNTQQGPVRYTAHIVAGGMAVSSFNDVTLAILGPDPIATVMSKVGMASGATGASAPVQLFTPVQVA